MLINHKFFDDSTQESTHKDSDPINILIRRNAIPEDMKQKIFSKPTDASVLAAEFDLDMFRVLSQREYRQITRYDTMEKDLTPEECVEKCRNSSEEAQGLSPVYNGETYVWQPVKVEGYDYEAQRYKVTVLLTGQQKLVTRLALRFNFENNEQFYSRLRECRERRDIVETELRFQELVDVVKDEDVSTLPDPILQEITKKMQIKEDKFDPAHVRETSERLISVISSIYRLAMKKCRMITDSLGRRTIARLEDIKIPVKFTRVTIPYFGLLYLKRGMKKNFTLSLESESELISRSLSLPRVENTLRSVCNTSRVHNKTLAEGQKMTMSKVRRRERRRLTQNAEKLLNWQTGNTMVGSLFDNFQLLCQQFKQKPLFQFSLARLQLPMRSSNFMNIQEKRIKAVSAEILNSWRFQTLHNIRQSVKGQIAFDISQMEVYEVSRAKMMIRKFDYIFRCQLCEFFNYSINGLVKFIQAFSVPKNEKLWKISNLPLLEVDISYTGSEEKKDVSKTNPKDKKKKHGRDDRHKKVKVEKEIFFRPSLEECKQKILYLLDRLLDVADKVNVIETEDYNVFLRVQKRSAYPMSNETLEVKAAREYLGQVISECCVRPAELLEKFKKYTFIAAANIQEVSRIMEGETPPVLEDLRKRLEEYSRSEYEIRTLAIDKVQFSMFQVDTSYIKKYLAHRANKLKDALLKAINKYCIHTIEDVVKKYTELQNNLEEKPTTKDAYKVLKTCLKESDMRVGKLKTLHELIGSHIELLEDHQFKVEQDVYYKFFTLYCFPKEIRSKREKGNKNLLNFEEQLRADLERQKDQFDKELCQYKENYEAVIQFTDTESAQNQYRFAFELQKNIEKAVEKAKELNDDEELLEMKKTEYSALDKLQKDFQPFCSLIFNTDDIQRSMEGWYNNSFITLKPSEIVEKIDSWMTELDSLNKQLEEFKDQGDVTIDLQNIVKEFSQHLDLIKYLRSEAMKEEEWVRINKVTSLKLKFNDEALTLNTLIGMNAENYKLELKEIWECAEKKLELEKSLKRMKEEMNKKKLEVYKYEKANAYLVNNYGTLLKYIDDQIVSTEAMINSIYINAALKRAGIIWSSRLVSLREILEELTKCQSIWQYLEPIFSSEIIQLTLKLEYDSFLNVDTRLKQQTEMMNTDNLVVSLLEKERIKEDFVRANEDLEGILKNMSDFLEATRKKFPRFYFISDSDLVLLFSKAMMDPQTLQPYFSKCFESIESFEITYPAQEVIAVTSQENEKINLIRVLGLKEGDRKGRIEIWLKDLDKILHETLQDLFKRSLKDYATNSRAEWMKSWPGQIVQLVSQVDWTANVQSLLESNKLAEYKAKYDSEMTEMITTAQGELDLVNRLTIETLLTLCMHSRDIIKKLCDQKIESKDDFEWTSQMRYTCNNEDINVCMLATSLKYGFEYIGNSTRLVVTPLTDRCYRVLLTAKQMNQGGALIGAAGVGKTETIKDLAKAIGGYCVVFNASEELDHLTTSRLFKGITTAGAWCCFDEFSKIDPEVLSVISSQLMIIKNALVTKQSTFQFNNDEVELNPQCGINITINPTNIEQECIPNDLKASFRPFTMSAPDYVFIGEIMLYSYGFHEAKTVAKKIVSVLKLCKEQLSIQDHYDFGMRNLQTILKMMKVLRRKLPEEKEEVLAIKALNDSTLSKLASKDISVYNKLITNLFPDVEKITEVIHPLAKAIEEALVSDKLQPLKAYVKKCIQIHEATLSHNGVIIIGEAFSGKSQAIKTLKKALMKVKEINERKYESMLVHTLNPKSVDLKQLYGSFDEEEKVWCDGILPKLMAECTKIDTADEKWIIFDGPIDNVWMKSMNTVLDDNKKLCLPSGSVLKLKSNLTILFEVEQLKYAGPATLSRCGIVFMESNYLDWTALVKSYTEGLPQVLTPKIIKAIEELMASILRAVITFLNKYAKFYTETSSIQLMKGFLSVFESFISDSRLEGYKLPADLDKNINSYALFSLIWGMGSYLEPGSKERYNEFLQDIINEKDVKMKYKLDLGTDNVTPKIRVKLPEGCDLFNMTYDKEKKDWVEWMSTIEDPFAGCNNKTIFYDLIVPTKEFIQTRYLLKQFMKSSMHILIAGPKGIGKTINILSELKKPSLNTQQTYIRLSLSGIVTASQAQYAIESKLEKRGRKSQYGPLKGKKGVIFVDDLNMPNKDQYESQPVLELIRQWMDYGGWYDIDSQEHEFKVVESVSFVGAMSYPGKQSISMRCLRHFHSLYIESQDEATLNSMFRTLLDWKLNHSSTKYADEVLGLTKSVAEATIEIYSMIIKHSSLRPVPSKSHYIFNVRDISKVFQGLCRSTVYAIRKADDIIKLWTHECTRVFQDRLVNSADREAFIQILKECMKKHLNKEWESIVSAEPLMFGNFVPFLISGTDDKDEFVLNIYSEITDRNLLKTTIEDHLNRYNVEAHSGTLKLVLFTYAMEHIVSICRILSLPHSHALLVGIGGAGQKSLSSLAAFIGNLNIFRVERSCDYSFADWRADLRKLMTITGIDKTPTALFLTDEQVHNDSFLEDINSLVTIGEVPNLYAKQGKSNELMVKLKENIQLHSKKVIGSDEEALEFLRNLSRKNLHIIFSLNPTINQFRERLREFPFIMNNTTMNWFLPWPKEALTTVAHNYLANAELQEDEKEGIVNICADMQEKVTSLAEEYKMEMNFHYYVTPTHYLELLSIFKKLLVDRKELIKGTKLYQNGLEELAKTETLVTEMRNELVKMEPAQKKCNENATSLATSLTKKKAEVQEETKVVQRDEEIARETKKVADDLQAECQANYDKALPELREAENAIKDIDAAAISTMQALSSPADVLKQVAKALCMLLNIKPKTVPKSEPDYWLPKKIFTHKSMKKLTEYDKENIPLAKITDLRKVTDTPEFDVGKITAASVEAGTIARWILALLNYDQVNREVVPLKTKLKEESEKAQAAQESLAKTSKQLEEKKAVLAELKQQLDAAEVQKKKYAQQIDVTEKQIERAHDLLDLLKNESKRWNEYWKNLQERYKNFLGDIVISSGIIAYLGVFPRNYRNSCIKTWCDRLVDFGITKSSSFSLFDTLYDSLQTFIWRKQKLPSDSMSIENAIIMEKSSRWPLFIDPQMQAINWIKARERVEVIKKTQKQEQILNKLISAVSGGAAILFEDMDDKIDPIFIPLIKKELVIESKQPTIKLGEEIVIYNNKFKLYMTTRLKQPHYSSEICSGVTMINFTATEEALTDQMLNIIVQKEDPIIQKNREDSIQKSVDIRQKLRNKEEEVLKIVTSKKDEIFKSDQLLDTLRNTKSECQKFTLQMEEQKKANEKIELARSKFQSVARRVASLYFCISDLVKVESMYQYSLEWYTELYIKSLNVATDVDQVEKLNLYKSNFTYSLFTNICKSLFEKDKFLFTVSVLLHIFVSEDMNTPAEVNFLLSGLSATTTKTPNNPVTNWLSDKGWQQIFDLSQSFPAFKDFDTEITKCSTEWETIVNSQNFINPSKYPWPNNWSDPKKLNSLQQLLVISSIRPEKFMEAVRLIIVNYLGSKYLEYPSLNLEEAYNSSSHKIPILFILSPGADPLLELKSFLSSRRLADELIPVSLGKGQEKKADLALTRALEAKATTWMLIQNCHLGKSSLFNLEKRLEELNDEPKQPFRLWLTSMPTDIFPAALLQKSIKITTERPKGIARRMTDTYSRLDNSVFNSTKPNSSQWRRLLYNLAMFHAVVQERSKYGYLGWNFPYSFVHSDFVISMNQLQTFEASVLPWNVIEYCIAETNYGGYITDKFDYERIKAIFSDFFNKDVLKDDYNFRSNSKYVFPKDLKTKQEYIKHIKSLPQIDDPEVFGLSPTANLTCSINSTHQMLATLLSLSSSIATTESREQAGAKINTFINNVPAELTLEDETRVFTSSYHKAVLLQELSKYNSLISTIKKSLNEVQVAMQGQSAVTSDMEDIIDSLLKNKLPRLWRGSCYPTAKSASCWLEDLKERMQFFKEWTEKGSMSSYWISAFFFPQSFFTAVLQNHAQTNGLPIDSLIMDYSVISYKEKEEKPVGCIIHGLFITGAKLGEESGCLEEADSKAQYSPMPQFRARPREVKEVPQDKNVYECPVYNTENRQETVNANGCSSILMMTIELPIAPGHTVKHWMKRGVAMVAQLNS